MNRSDASTVAAAIQSRAESSAAVPSAWREIAARRLPTARRGKVPLFPNFSIILFSRKTD